jgi:hypothetical protein
VGQAGLEVGGGSRQLQEAVPLVFTEGVVQLQCLFDKGVAQQLWPHFLQHPEPTMNLNPNP